MLMALKMSWMFRSLEGGSQRREAKSVKESLDEKGPKLWEDENK